jgi:hypothetical protein
MREERMVSFVQGQNSTGMKRDCQDKDRKQGERRKHCSVNILFAFLYPDHLSSSLLIFFLHPSSLWLRLCGVL